jgi:hypothetical protein
MCSTKPDSAQHVERVPLPREVWSLSSPDSTPHTNFLGGKKAGKAFVMVGLLANVRHVIFPFFFAWMGRGGVFLLFLFWMDGAGWS